MVRAWGFTWILVSQLDVGISQGKGSTRENRRIVIPSKQVPVTLKPSMFIGLLHS